MSRSDTFDAEWRVHEKYPNYRVSADGKIVQNIRTGRVLKQCDNNKGYPTVNLYNDGERTTYSVHRLVAELYSDGASPDLTVNHEDGNKHNNHPDNLTWVSYSENERHAHRTGLKHGPKRRPVRVVESGEVFPSVRACARAICGSDTNILRCLDGTYQSHHGLTFEYADIDPDKVEHSDGTRSRAYATREPYRKAVRIVETGDVYPSVTACARAIDGDQPTITACLKGRHKTHHGYHYEWVD